MADRYDPKSSLRPSGDTRPPETTGPDAPAGEDPLVELARIVSGRSVFDTPRETAAPRPLATPEGQSSGAPRPLPSGEELAHDLEAELLNELQASFSTISQALPKLNEPEPPVEAETPPPAAAAPTTPAKPLSHVDDIIEAAFAESGTDWLREEIVRPPEATPPPTPTPSVLPETLPPAAMPSGNATPDRQIRPPRPIPQPESLAERLARVTQGDARPETPAIRPPAAIQPPAAARSPVGRTTEPNLPNPPAIQFRPAAAAPAPESVPDSLPAIPEVDQDSTTPLDLSRFAPPGEAERAAQANGGRKGNRSPAPEGLDDDPVFGPADDAYPDDDLTADGGFGSVPGYEDAYADDALDPPRSRRRPVAIAAVLAALLATGALAFLWNSGAGTDGPPPVIAAEAGPTKVQPEASTTPAADSQSKLVYDRVDPGTEAAGSHLVRPESGSGIPPIPQDSGRSDVSRVILQGGPSVDDPSQAGSDDGGISSVIRTEGEDEDSGAIGPKRVRTVIVRPDGTIVSSASAEEGANPPVATGGQAAVPAVDPLQGIPSSSETPAPPGSEGNPLLAEDFGSGSSQAAQQQAPAQSAVPAPPPAPPAQAAPPSRPQQTAALDARPVQSQQPASSGLGGGFLIQVSSQRSQDAALSTFRDLQRRYPYILGGRAPDVQRVDLGDKGVYYRVRVGYNTRAEAVSMCENLKASGGDCFLATR